MFSLSTVAIVVLMTLLGLGLRRGWRSWRGYRRTRDWYKKLALEQEARQVSKE